MYDYLIAGSGIAGNVCAYLLAKAGKKCIILEKELIRKEKVCGGGIPYKAVQMLKEMGMETQLLFDMDISVIEGDVSYYPDYIDENKYEPMKFSIGSQRKIFDEFLLEQAVKQGADIKRGEKVKEIICYNDLYTVNGYNTKNVIVAVGARGFSQRYVKGQSIGISAQIQGKCDLDPHYFYYWYYDGTDEKYFWIFPIGNNKWNIGLWYQVPGSSMKKDFEKCWRNIFESHFKADYIILQKPTTEFLGNVDLCDNNDEHIIGMGDYAGINNLKNGGGIYQSIKSVVRYVNNIIN